ncbi:putative helicase mov-10-B.1 isoform X2 [Anthonomus grandis grandis]|uniref:putative helicase mov-10-B.1 isoform X2 n=1 Tax=Anthonomus grandis grandis TaxID=2921223 RepID=UPI0021661DC4|nr:putative helicase mov-10-B.1 isoform X2 [Anthonomus grandis grandis]
MASVGETKRPKDCKLCFEELDDLHLESSNHVFNYMLSTYQENKTSLRSDRHGVVVEVDVQKKNGFNYNFDTTQKKTKGKYTLKMTPKEFYLHGCQVEFSCVIKNIRREKNVAMIYAGVLHPYEPFSMVDPNNNMGKFPSLKPGGTYGLKVILKLDKCNVSNYEIPIFFSLQAYSKQNKESMMNFSITRTIVVIIQEDILEPDLFEKSPFTHNEWQKVQVHKHSKRYMPTDQFKIPQKYKRSLALWSYNQERNINPAIWQEFQEKLYPGTLSADNYADFWKILLWLEEIKTKIALQAYNMEKVTLKFISSSQGLRLGVPGLGEKRPSVIRGDKIVIKIHDQAHKSYEGLVGHVGDKAVDIVDLDDEIVELIKREPDTLIDVKFILSRIHFERMHHGVEQVALNGLTRQLFPGTDLLKKQYTERINLGEQDFHNGDIYKNYEQRLAVTKIVNLSSKGAAPYIVYGPPGTGKTVTIVEAIYQLKRNTDLKILVCAPANAACHMLAEKLSEFCRTSELLRVMSETCDTSSIHDNIVKYCNVIRDKDKSGSEKLKVIPFPQEKLKDYRIVVTTLVFAGKYTRVYHPDVVFLDEAAQASEPEACCALSLLMPDKFVVLAGDPKQLGPVVNNKVCKNYGYGISLLERLSDLTLYKNDLISDNNFTTMLKLNFRSHKEVLAIPNEQFYGNNLEACSVISNHDPLAFTRIHSGIMGGKVNQKKGGAVEFCAVLAKEQRHGRSPSYFNSSEVNVVLQYVTALMALQFPDKNKNLRPSEIGIVTPYIRQVYKIREVLSPLYKDEIEVGTTEAFQGREKRVIIISTVRGQHDLLLEDKKYKIGFVHEPKRFNVAVTRAKSKLIIIGNPLILNRDKLWKKLIEQSSRLGTHCGVPYTNRDQKERDNITSRFKNLQLKDFMRTSS